MVVVVVVTTVVRVAGANENWPMLGVGPTVVFISRCFSTSRLRVDFEEAGRDERSGPGIGDASRARDREPDTSIALSGDFTERRMGTDCLQGQ